MAALVARSCLISCKSAATKNDSTWVLGSVVTRNLFGFGKKPGDGEQAKPALIQWGDKTIYEKQFDKNVFWKPRKEVKFSMLQFLQQPINLEPKAVRNWMERKLHNMRVRGQESLPERRAALGADIAAAYMMLFVGGSVRFSSHNFWISKKKDEHQLPKFHIPKLYLDAVNLDKTEIIYEGLENIAYCKHIKSLSLRECDLIDDWCLDSITSGGYRTTLEHLDISKCKNVTERGLAVLHRFRSLKTLVLEEMTHVKHLELTCLCLEDAIPGLNVVGVDYNLDAAETDLQALSGDEEFVNLNCSNSVKHSGNDAASKAQSSAQVASVQN